MSKYLRESEAARKKKPGRIFLIKKSHAKQTFIRYLYIVCHLLCSSLIVLNVENKTWSLTDTSKSWLRSSQSLMEIGLFVYSIFFCCWATRVTFDTCYFKDIVRKYRIYLIT